MMSLLDLPTELLDQVFSYLDWDRSRHLEPTKQDIVNASLTCKHLRKVLAPIVFRDVTLRLRWVDEALVEPLLYKLRRERPELAEHIRCVYIRAEYEPCLHCAQREDPSAFLPPDDVADWLHPNGWSTHASGDLEVAYRSNVDAMAQKILNPLSALSGTAPAESAEEAIISFRQRNGRNSDLDALAVVMLCIPASTNCIVFRSLTDNYVYETKNNFSLRTLAIALDLHRRRIQDLTIISNAAAGRLTMSRRALARLGTGGGEQTAISNEVLADLKTHRLVIAINDRFTYRQSANVHLSSYERWHCISHCVRELELHHIKTEISEMSKFVKGFQNLNKIRIQQCVLQLPSRQIVPARRPELEASIWLAFAIDLRRAMQNVKIELSQLHRPHVMVPQPECTTQWIVSQAVPTGCLIDADREDRLLVDFASFVELWQAEQSERGAQAMAAWSTQRAKLSDDAMTRRWR